MKQTRKYGNGKTLLTRKELAEELGVSTRTIGRLTLGQTAQRIPYLKIGNQTFYRLEKVLDALEAATKR